MFALDESERGEVRGVQHEIETGDSPQPVRRVPFALRVVGEMLSNGIIRDKVASLLVLGPAQWCL